MPMLWRTEASPEQWYCAHFGIPASVIGPTHVISFLLFRVRPGIDVRSRSFEITLSGVSLRGSEAAPAADAVGVLVSALGYRVTLDTQALSHNLLPFPNWDGGELSPGNHDITLEPGSYRFYFQSGRQADFALTVTADGAVEVEPAGEYAEVNGRTVVIKGYGITLDTSALSHNLLPFGLLGWAGGELSPRPYEMTLVPGKGYVFLFHRGRQADFTLTVTADGAVEVEPAGEYAEVNGRTVVIKGYGITLDTSALSHNLLPFGLLGWAGGELSPRPHEMTLVPGKGYVFLFHRGRQADFTLTVTADGAVEVEPAGEYAEVNGRTVVIKGYGITLDTSALSHNLLPFGLLGWAGGELSPRPHEMTLVPGKGYVFLFHRGRQADFTLTVTADGAVEVEPAGEYAEVNGRTVVIKGYGITLDTSALSHNLLPFGLLGWAGGELSPRPHEMTLVPGKGYVFLFHPGRQADFTLTVTADGAVDVEPAGEYAEVNGRTVVIKGYGITLDTSALSHNLLPFGLLGWAGGELSPRPHKMTLVPGKGYVFSFQSGLPADFTVTVRG